MAPRSISTASLSFGLVTIPVKMYSTTSRESKVSFHWLHEKCGTRVRMQWFCPKDEEVVTRAEMVRGYEVSKGRYVPIEEEELAETKAESRDDIGVIEFVPADTINPLFYEHAYYLAPDRHGDRAYAILARALGEAGRVAIGRYAARGDEHVVAIMEQDGGLVMLQLRFADEVRSIDEIPLPSVRIDQRELALAQQLLEQNASAAFDAKKYKDEVRLKKLALIEGKVGEGIIAEEEPATAAKGGAPIDLMAALEASLTGAGNGARHHAPRKKRDQHRRASTSASASATHRRRTRSTTRRTSHSPSRRSASAR